MQCLICDQVFDHLPQPGRKLSTHIRKAHGLSVDEYLIEHAYGGVRPSCKVCGSDTRRVGFVYKKFCKEHVTEASVHGGRRGGKATAWNKGLTKDTDDRVAKQAKQIAGEGNPFFGRRHTEDSLQKMRRHRRITPEQFDKRCQAFRDRGVEVLTEYDAYFSRQNQYLIIRCSECGQVDKKTLQALERGSRCIRCYPITTSQAEQQIANLVVSLVGEEAVVRNDRHLIGPREIDVLIRSSGVGIEYDGLYWHSDAGRNVISPQGSRQKVLDCDRHGIRLIRIYEDQWRDQRKICESIIRHALGCSQRIFARKCSQPEIANTREANDLLENWHLYGGTPARIGLCLNHEGRPVSVMTLRSPRQKKYRSQNFLEVARFASIIDHVVVGGLQRVLRQAIIYAQNEGFDGLITYADLDVGPGHSYRKAGFDHIGDTGPTYWYTNGQVRYDRFKYRASQGRTEREVACAAGVHRIYGAGSRIYVMRW